MTDKEKLDRLVDRFTAYIAAAQEMRDIDEGVVSGVSAIVSTGCHLLSELFRKLAPYGDTPLRQEPFLDGQIRVSFEYRGITFFALEDEDGAS